MGLLIAGLLPVSPTVALELLRLSVPSTRHMLTTTQLVLTTVIHIKELLDLCLSLTNLSVQHLVALLLVPPPVDRSRALVAASGRVNLANPPRRRGQR